jgi:hypothetical protein
VASLVDASEVIETIGKERDAALAEVERLRVTLWATDQASPEDLPLPAGLDAVNIARQHYGQVLKISDKLADHFGDENEHLGQPYGNVYDAILDAFERLIAESKDGES